ncbi:hypothetical protein AYB33_16165 [Leptospira santarosai]|nr:hypothetical protein AYB33_16165 [Leptospira santarosai]
MGDRMSSKFCDEPTRARQDCPSEGEANPSLPNIISHLPNKNLIHKSEFGRIRIEQKRSRPLGSDGRQDVEQVLRRAYASEAGLPERRGGESFPAQYHFSPTQQKSNS